MKIKQKIKRLIEGMLLVATLASPLAVPGCAKPQIFEYEGKIVVIGSESYGETTTSIKDGSMEIKIVDGGSDGLLTQVGDAIEVKEKGKNVFSKLKYERLYDVSICGVHQTLSPEKKQELIGQYELLIQDIYQSIADKTKGTSADSFMQEVKQKQLVKTIETKVFSGVLPSDKEYSKISSGTIMSEAKSEVISDMGSEETKLIDLEEKYKVTTEVQARKKGLEQIAGIVSGLGKGYVAVVKDVSITYSGLDLDEKVMGLVTSESKEDASSTSVGLLGYSGSKMHGEKTDKQYQKSVKYEVQEKIDYEVFKEEGK